MDVLPSRFVVVVKSCTSKPACTVTESYGQRTALVSLESGHFLGLFVVALIYMFLCHHIFPSFMQNG